MQVHTREAIKRKALIPICNCFSISTVLLTGPKSGSTLSPVSNLSALRGYSFPFLSFPFLSTRCVLLVFHSSHTRGIASAILARCRMPTDENRRKSKETAASSLPLIVNKSSQHHRDRVGSRREPASLPLLRRSPYDGPPFPPLNAPYRASFMFFAKPNYEPSYAHHTTAAIFRASTQFFRARTALLSRLPAYCAFHLEKPSRLLREHIRERTFSSIIFSFYIVPFTRRPNKCHFSAKVMQH